MGKAQSLAGLLGFVSAFWPRLGGVFLLFFFIPAQRTAAAEPLVSTIKRDESIVFYPTAAWREESGAGWVVPIHGCVYEVEPRQITVAAVVETLGWGGRSLTQEQQAILRERLRFMTVDNHRGRRVVISLGTEKFALGKSGSDGHFRRDLRLSESQWARLAETTNARPGEFCFSAVLEPDDTRAFCGAVTFTAATGITVISDIDDTIKRTQVRDLKAMLRASFLEPFIPVPDMARLYREWEQRSDVQIWYVSASPWQFYQPLSGFLSRESFPAGPISLRKVRFKDKSLAELFKQPDSYKRKTIGEILNRFPTRKFILVGDSGENDPEVYGDLARRYPAQVVGVLIRDVTSDTENSARYSAAFRDISRQQWRVFTQPEQVLDFPVVAAP